MSISTATTSLRFSVPYARFLLLEEWKSVLLWLGSRLRVIVCHLSQTHDMLHLEHATYLQYVDSLRNETCNGMLIAAAADMHYPGKVKPHGCIKFMYHLLLSGKTPTRERLRGLDCVDCPTFTLDCFAQGWWTSLDKKSTETAEDLLLEWRRWTCETLGDRFLEGEGEDEDEDEDDDHGNSGVFDDTDDAASENEIDPGVAKYCDPEYGAM
ncbi:hypothetical protein BKA70DRAFT_1218370 [Coprinopsis sp. MPI-PUGE-AT-0042]|nr:hypothetical protein BKA70DRAFT_1219116 [Coprinopsis sp. MPI-PUGE-AT-0042]KAH6913419.1 hypothetical protein BKA70DRAFT_1218370 [Coprinopsis sp. MPI-PUGE-AT-0042]